MKRPSTLAKLAKPRSGNVLLRKRLFKRLDEARKTPVIYITAPPGAGKTTLISAYLEERTLPHLWYQIDEGDGDIASFFHYMGLAAKQAAPRYRKPLPHLNPEYLLGLPTFTRNFFRELFGRLQKGMERGKREAEHAELPRRRFPGSPFLVVLDNYQDAPADSPLHEIIQMGVSELPEGINVIIISRARPPDAMARLLASDRLTTLNWDDLRLTEEESFGIAKLRRSASPSKEGDGKLPRELLRAIHERTQGWAVGLVLMLEQFKVTAIPEERSKQRTHEAVFNYFAGEIFQRTDEETREFLLKTAFLPKMTIPMVERLTGIGRAGQILSYLNNNQYFIKNYFQEEPVYEYHQLFREFLLVRARGTFSADELSLIQHSAAEMLSETGQTEDAAALLCDLRDWDGFISLILSHAQSFIKQGRTKTLEGWIHAIPDDIFHRQPWLLFYMGACRISSHLPEARQFYEKAFHLFKTQNDRPGIFLSLSGVMDTYFHECEYGHMGSWVDLLEEVLKQDNSFPTPEIEERIGMYMFMALAFNRPQHPDIAMYEERALALMQKSRDINLCLQTGISLLVYHVWMGNFHRAGFVLDVLKGPVYSKDCSDLTFLSVKSAEIFYAYFTGSATCGHESISEALHRSEQSGAHVWDLQLYEQWLAVALNEGDMRMASELLQKIQARLKNARRFDVGHYHYLSAWHAFLQGDLLGAWERQNTANEISEG